MTLSKRITRAAFWMAIAFATAMSGALSPVRANTPFADAFLLIPVSAREIGIGQATVPLYTGATAFHWNPAGLSSIETLDVATSYSRLYTGIGNHQMISVAFPAGTKELSASLSWVRLGVDDIPRYPTLPVLREERSLVASAGPLGYFGYAQNAYFLTVSRQNEINLDLGWEYLILPMSVPVGATVKYLTASTGDSTYAADGSGIGLDLGVQSHFDLGRALDSERFGRMSLGLALANVGGTRMTWNTPTERTDTIGFGIRYGVAYYQPVEVIRGEIMGTMTSGTSGTSWGLEYTFLEMISLRTGRDTVKDNSLAFGAGFVWRGLSLDYGLSRHPLGASHRVSMGYAY